MEDNRYHTVIKSQKSTFDFKEVWRYRDLILLFVQRNFKLVYKQTILGPLWLILNPLLTSVIFTFIFGGFGGISTDGLPQFLFYLSGNTIWGMFNTSVLNTANTFIANANIFGKIYFPRVTVPISQILSAVINFLIQFVMLALFWVYYYLTGAELTITPYILLVPLLLIQAILLALGVGVIVSSLTTKYRDLAIAVSFGMQLWMYASPVVYPISETGGMMREIILLNPVTPIIHNFKFALFGSDELLTGYWLLSWIVTLVLLFFGLRLFNKVEKTFIDTV